MMLNLLQNAGTTGSYVTGTFLVDGALLIAGFKLVEEVIKAGLKSLNKRNGKSRPEPGQGEVCREHGEAIAALIEFKKNAENSLARIETKVDRLLERK